MKIAKSTHKPNYTLGSFSLRLIYSPSFYSHINKIVFILNQSHIRLPFPHLALNFKTAHGFTIISILSFKPSLISNEEKINLWLSLINFVLILTSAFGNKIFPPFSQIPYYWHQKWTQGLKSIFYQASLQNNKCSSALLTPWGLSFSPDLALKRKMISCSESYAPVVHR